MKVFTVIGECKYYSSQFMRYMTEMDVIGSFRTKELAESYIKEMGNDDENPWEFFILESWMDMEDEI